MRTLAYSQDPYEPPFGAATTRTAAANPTREMLIDGRDRYVAGCTACSRLGMRQLGATGCSSARPNVSQYAVIIASIYIPDPFVSNFHSRFSALLNSRSRTCVFFYYF